MFKVRSGYWESERKIIKGKRIKYEVI